MKDSIDKSHTDTDRKMSIDVRRSTRNFYRLLLLVPGFRALENGGEILFSNAPKSQADWPSMAKVLVKFSEMKLPSLPRGLR